MTCFQRIEESIKDFRQAAFEGSSRKTSDRKKAMIFAAHSCPDNDIASILGGSVDWIVSKPEHVRSAISKAYDTLETLKYLRPDLDR